ncbi:alpha/beta hydrolase fold [Gracilaria domingensis]|nr:alpha/beta hydrolase fold [Gracilaria domingensis]
MGVHTPWSLLRPCSFVRCSVLRAPTVNQIASRRTARKGPISYQAQRRRHSSRAQPAMSLNVFQILVVAGATISGTLLTALYVLQERLIYHPTIPTREYEKNPKDYGMDYNDVDVLTTDRVRLHGWLIKQQRPKDSPTVIYFHGNAGNIAHRISHKTTTQKHRLPDVRYYHRDGFNVFMVSYRGYGRSEGYPSEKGMRLDGEAALEYIRDRSDLVDTNRIYVFGRSIGGACAIALASSAIAKDSIRGLIVENTFTSTNDLVDSVLPMLKPFKAFNRNKWDSLSVIKEIKVPILFLSGMQDGLVPPAQMQKLREAALKAPFSVMHTVEDGDHNVRLLISEIETAVNKELTTDENELT